MTTLKVSSAVLDGRLETGGFAIGIQDGVIASVRRETPDGPWSPCIALPGLVQTHVHLCQTLFRGMAEDRTLIPWLEERVWPLEAAHTEDTLAASVILSLRELLSSGCTGLLDMGSVELSGVTVDLLRRSGVRAVACNALMDAGSSSLRRDLGWLKAETGRVRDSCGGLVSHGLAPRFALSCSDPLWEWIGEEDGIRTTHASESPSELAWPAIENEGGNIRFLHRRGFLGRGTLLAHCVHLGQGEPELLASTGTSVVHCPWTNLRLGSGIADVPRLEELGVPVSLGSDGSACNNALSPAGDARLAMALSSVTSAPGRLGGAYWLDAVTSSAAASLGWEGCGTVSPGCAADIVLLEPSERERDELPLAEDPLRFVLEMDWPSRVRLTVTGGSVLYRDGEYPTLPPLPVPVDEARTAVASRAGLRK